MSLLDLMRARHSVRAFANRPVPRELLLRVAEAARLAPTACNNQPWRFLIVDDQPTLQALAAGYPARWFRTAPAVIVACAVEDEAWRRGDLKSYADVDVAIAVDHAVLAASEAGLGTCWVGAFDPATVHAALGLPPRVTPLALLPLGFPDADEKAATRHLQRKPLEALVRWHAEGPAPDAWWRAPAR